jgi:hypothetical protein
MPPYFSAEVFLFQLIVCVVLFLVVFLKLDNLIEAASGIASSTGKHYADQCEYGCVVGDCRVNQTKDMKRPAAVVCPLERFLRHQQMHSEPALQNPRMLSPSRFQMVQETW